MTDVNQHDTLNEQTSLVVDNNTPTTNTDDLDVDDTGKSLEMVNERVTQDYDTVVKCSRKDDNDITNMPALPSITYADIERNPGHPFNQLLTGKRDEESINDNIMIGSIYHSLFGGIYNSSFTRENSDWHQSIEQDGMRFRASRPRFKEPEKGSKISADVAIRKLEQKFGLGGYINVPLVHSGLWVRLRPPTPMEFAFLNEKILMEKEAYGKQSMGMIFSNSKTYIVSHLMDFIEDHIEDMNLENWKPSDLRRLCKISDFKPLVAAAIHSMYPNGFDYVTPCVADTDCGKPSTYRLKIINCVWYDRSRLTKAQKRHMLDRGKYYKEEDIIKYQDELDESNGNSITIDDFMEIFFKVPTIQQNIEAGYQWLEDTEEMVNNAFDENLNSDQRVATMNNSLKMTVLRQYGHFFKSIRFLEDDTYIEEGDTLNNALDRFSTIDEYADKIIEHIGEYINKQALAIVAIPRVPCKNCGGQNNTEVEKHPFLIPIDPINLFFTMGTLKGRLGSQS